jgi:DNA-binding winged helix-turn-helix (wHTH) protein/Tfp pilus assembly protein PilF
MSQPLPDCGPGCLQTDVAYEFGPYLLEPAQWRLRHGDRVVPLPPKALSLLLVLVEKHGALVAKDEVLAKVWAGTFVEEGNVAFYVAMLRKLLSEPAGATYIETIKTRGYRFVVPVVVRPTGQITAQEPLSVQGDGTDGVTPPVALPGRRFGLAAFAATALLVATVAAGVLLASFRRESIDPVVGVPFHAIAPAGEPRDGARVTRRETVSGEAYDLFLQGRERWRTRTPESVKQAIELYEKAIAIDPQFSRAYAGLADCYNIAMSGLPPNYRYPRARENVEKAIALDPDSAEAHTSLAFMRYKFEWRWQDADDEFRLAIKLNPRYQLAHHWYGEFLGLMDRTDEAMAELNTALELDPLSLAVRADMVPPLLRARRFAEARRVLETGLQIDRNWYGFPLMRAEVLAVEGRDRESAEQTWRAMTLRGVPGGEIDELRTAFDHGGMREMIRAQIRQLLRQDGAQRSSASLFTAQSLSFAYARLGEREEALRWLEISIARREDAPLHMLTNWAYDSIRDDPRFVRILERLNLTHDVKR